MREVQPRKITRRAFVTLTAATLASLCLPGTVGSYEPTPTSAVSSDGTVLTHEEFLSQFLEASSRSNSEDFINNFKKVMVQTAKDCVINRGYWIYPSKIYRNYFFARDSYWVLATLQDRPLLEMTQKAFHNDQLDRPDGDDGHIATALILGGEKPPTRDNDDESTLIDIIREYELLRAGGTPDERSLEISMKYIFNHLDDYRYTTTGDSNVFQKEDRVNAFHYWLDTYRPDGLAIPSRQMFTYNQGMLCVALKCLERFGMITDPSYLEGAKAAYQQMVSSEDNISLSQRPGSGIMDVSSLAGDAMSLYYFDEPLLDNDKVHATIDRFTKTFYRDGKFLGFKVVSSLDGSYLPGQDFIESDSKNPGSYHNGGSWLLKDALALYSGARHNVPWAIELFLQRMKSELRTSNPDKAALSHEFLFTSGEEPGSADPNRDNYGWNSFSVKLLP